VVDENYAHMIRGLSGDFLRYVNDELFGTGKGFVVDDLGAYDFLNDDEDESGKHCLSPTTMGERGDHKRPRTRSAKATAQERLGHMEDEDEMLQMAIEASLLDAQSPQGKDQNEAPPADTALLGEHLRSSSPSSISPDPTLGTATTATVKPPAKTGSARDIRAEVRARRLRHLNSVSNGMSDSDVMRSPVTSEDEGT